MMNNEQAEKSADSTYLDLGQKLSLGKLVLLGIITLALCSFGPLSFFASVPLSVAILLYGRSKSIVLIGVFFAITSFFAYQFPPLGYLPFIYLIAGVLGSLNAEVILRKWHPIKGILFFGLMLVGLVFVFFVGLSLFSDVSMKVMIEEYVQIIFVKIQEQNQEIITAGGEQARMLEDLLSQPKVVAKEIISWAPAMIFGLTFFSLWACQFLILRNSVIWKLKHSYPYSVKELVNFKVPEFFLYPLLGSFAIFLAGEHVGETVRILGQNVLYGVCVFYFFQGFGVYIRFLDFAKIYGFIRTFLVLFTLTVAWRIVILAGILDVWFDFRKRLEKKEEQ